MTVSPCREVRLVPTETINALMRNKEEDHECLTCFEEYNAEKTIKVSTLFGERCIADPIVGHAGDNGELIHFNHFGCLWKWVQQNNSCPTCHVPLNEKSLRRLLPIDKPFVKKVLFNAIALGGIAAVLIGIDTVVGRVARGVAVSYLGLHSNGVFACLVAFQGLFFLQDGREAQPKRNGNSVMGLFSASVIPVTMYMLMNRLPMPLSYNTLASLCSRIMCVAVTMRCAVTGSNFASRQNCDPDVLGMGLSTASLAYFLYPSVTMAALTAALAAGTMTSLKELGYL